MRLNRLALLAVLAPLAACQHPPLPPPILNIEGMPCGAQPDFLGAQHLELDADKKVTVDLQGTLPCFQTPDGTKVSYAAFALPESPQEYLVSVVSAQRGSALLPPHALIYDGLGRYLREIQHDAFQFHGPALSGSIRIHPGEHYVVVASADPQATIGHSLTQIVDGIGTYYYGNGGRWQFGVEGQNTLVFSYNGQVTASAFPMPKVK